MYWQYYFRLYLQVVLNASISEFINSQLDKYAATSSRLLHDAKIENYIDCTDYFYSDVGQEFLIKNNIPYKVVRVIPTKE